MTRSPNLKVFRKLHLLALFYAHQIYCRPYDAVEPHFALVKMEGLVCPCHALQRAKDNVWAGVARQTADGQLGAEQAVHLFRTRCFLELFTVKDDVYLEFKIV